MARKSPNAQQSLLDGQQELPIQAVSDPILNSPYSKPTAYWDYDRDSGMAQQQIDRRPARYYYKLRSDEAAKKAGQALLALDEGQRDLPLINALRDDVERWRKSGYRGAQQVTKDLLQHWNREDRYRRFFFCQLEAVETIIYLAEMRYKRPDGTRNRPQFNPRLLDNEFATFLDTPSGEDSLQLLRYGCKMATGSGKTVVMAMLIAWTLCNRGQQPTDLRFPRSILVCCPNLTVKERLQVLRPDSVGNYYEAFDIVPARLRPLMSSGKVLVTNWHGFRPEGEHTALGVTNPVQQLGQESDDAFARRLLGDLYDGAKNGGLLVLNDEAHHAYRPKPLEPTATLSAAQKAERMEATVWVDGLDRFNRTVGVAFCADLSATPFYIAGSGYAEGEPFPWLASDFGLVDAIESGITKIPRMPVTSSTGRPDPEFFNIWKHLRENRLQPGDYTGSGKSKKPKPEALWREAQPGLQTLADQWEIRFRKIQDATIGQERTPPVLIIVCDNTEIASYFYEQISGEREVDAAAEQSDDDADAEETTDSETDADETPAAKTKKAKKIIRYEAGKLSSQFFQNSPTFKPTLRVDSDALAKAEAGDGERKQDAAERLRRIVATVGKPGEPGEHIRCVVSVSMLTEGWDANTVTHIFGLRAFQSQLLCEQVVGRGLRRMNYDINRETGKLDAEYVDVYGVPFSLIPFKGKEKDKPDPGDVIRNHVFAMPERRQFTISFPNVDGYVFALQRNQITADVDKIEGFKIETDKVPTKVYVRPTIAASDSGGPLTTPGESEVHNRDEFYSKYHVQTIVFEIARRVVEQLAEGKLKGRMEARHQLFPQVLPIAQRYITSKIDRNGADLREIALQLYFDRIIERLVTAIEPSEDRGEQPLMPILNRYTPFSSTATVDFLTTKTVKPTLKSHINQVALDSPVWENSATFFLESSPVVACYARNEQLGFGIPYEYDGHPHRYEPDFLVRLTDGRMLILEIKGYEQDVANAKHQAAQRWVKAVNNLDKSAHWGFHVNHNPTELGEQLENLLHQDW